MTSLFWQYFKDVLNWMPLKSRYMQAIVRGLALQMDSTREDIIFLRHQFNIETSEPELLDDYGISRGIQRFPIDTDEQYRLRVINAYRWQKLAAKEWGLIRIIEECGYPGAKIEYDTNKEKWAEFIVAFGDENYGQDFSIIPIINEFKPARSKLSKVVTPAYSKGAYSVVGYAQLEDTISSIRVSPTLRLTIVGCITIYDYIVSKSDLNRG